MSENAASTHFTLNITNSGAGTVTPLANSFWKAIRVDSIGNTVP